MPVPAGFTLEVAAFNISNRSSHARPYGLRQPCCRRRLLMNEQRLSLAQTRERTGVASP
jgi:hypothetical protein